MSQIISIDPVTRIEGHLRIDVEVDGGKVVNAWSSGTMFRGYEMLMKGKDPWDAQQIMERICGVCPLVHGTAASYAIDDATGVQLPDNARLIRNIALALNCIQSNILHFYHLAALDYIDVTAVLNYSGGDYALNALKNRLRKLAEVNDLYPFLPRYESADYIGASGGPLDANAATELVSHYVQAFEMRKKAHEAIAIFYGRMPSFVGTIPGGVTQRPTVSNIAALASRIAELQLWIEKVYLADVLAIAGIPEYKPFMTAGASGKNYLAYGGFDEDQKGSSKFLPAGVILDGKPVGFDEGKVMEHVEHSFYTKDCGPLHPSTGKTDPELEKKDAYSFIKAPRYDGRPMEVGPLARMLVKKPEELMALASENDLTDVFGILPRTAARAIESKLFSLEIDNWLGQLDPKGDIWDPKGKKMPGDSKGRGLVEGPRGALGHWIHIKNGKTERYQAVVPTTWNASPRDEAGNRGPIEEALIGLPVEDVDNPINVVRCVRSFDPCLACAVHMIDPGNNSVKEFRVV